MQIFKSQNLHMHLLFMQNFKKLLWAIVKSSGNFRRFTLFKELSFAYSHCTASILVVTRYFTALPLPRDSRAVVTHWLYSQYMLFFESFHWHLRPNICGGARGVRSAPKEYILRTPQEYTLQEYAPLPRSTFYLGGAHLATLVILSVRFRGIDNGAVAALPNISGGHWKHMR